MIFPHICSRARRLNATTTVAFNSLQLKLRCIKNLQTYFTYHELRLCSQCSFIAKFLQRNDFTKSSRSENFSSMAHSFLINLQDNNPATGICLGVIRVTGRRRKSIFAQIDVTPRTIKVLILVKEKESSMVHSPISLLLKNETESKVSTLHTYV